MTAPAIALPHHAQPGWWPLRSRRLAKGSRVNADLIARYRLRASRMPVGPVRDGVTAASLNAGGSTMEPQEQRYDAFISYSHALDGQLAPAVQRGLGLRLGGD